MKKILIIGSSSLVGSHFVESFFNKYSISALGRRNIFANSKKLESFTRADITDETNLKDCIASSQADIVINYAAETNVDGCELERGNKSGSAYITNFLAATWIAEACLASNKELFHLSTDFVFDGTAGPYSEDSETGTQEMLSWYGETKLLAEKAIVVLSSRERQSKKPLRIVRLSYPFRRHFQFKEDFARRILTLYLANSLYPLYTDQIFTPTLVDEVSTAIDFMIVCPNLASGTYHVSSRNITNPFEFGSILISRFLSRPLSEVKDTIKKASVEEANASKKRARRPVKGGLKTEKIRQAGLVPLTFEESIDRFCLSPIN